MCRPFSSLEVLESRIAPAAATFSYADRDGDDVTIKVTTVGGSSAALKAALEAATDFTMAGGGLQLKALHLTDTIFEGANVSITAKRNATTGGDGLVAVGEIEALGRQLGSVIVDGDLGRISAGNGVGSTAVVSLLVRSFGRYGLETQGGGGNLNTLLFGDAGTVTVKEDVAGAVVQVVDGSLASISIGGSILGGSAVNSGSVAVTGDLGIAKVGGSIVSGEGNGSGKFSVFGNLTSLNVGGSLYGPTDNVADAGGQIDVGGNVAKLRIKGNLMSGKGGYSDSGQVDIGGNAGILQIGGSLNGNPATGNAGLDAATIRVFGAVGNLQIGGDIIGGSGGAARAGSVTLGSVTTLSIGGDVLGGSGTNTGIVDIKEGTVLSLTVGGSIIGGPSAGTGAIFGSFQKTVFKKIYIGGNIESRGNDFDQGFIRANSIGTVVVKGDLISSPEAGSDTEQLHGALGIGKLVVGGSILGNANNPVKIYGDQLGNVLVGKNAEYAEIAASNSAANVKSVIVKGAWISSRLAVSDDDGADNIYGTSDDPALPPGATGSIAKIVIKGQVAGTFGGGDSFRIYAPKIGFLSIAGTVYPFAVGPQNFALGITGDVVVRDVA